MLGTEDLNGTREGRPARIEHGTVGLERQIGNRHDMTRIGIHLEGLFRIGCIRRLSDVRHIRLTGLVGRLEERLNKGEKAHERHLAKRFGNGGILGFAERRPRCVLAFFAKTRAGTLDTARGSLRKRTAPTSQKQPQEASEFIRMEECGKPLSSDLFGCPR